MSLLFLLAGAASWLAFRYRSGGQYAGERFKRLLVPFIFGVLVIVPPQTWLAYNTITTPTSPTGSTCRSSSRRPTRV